MTPLSRTCLQLPSPSRWHGAGADAQHQDYSAFGAIGDGALSGGLAYEGLNNAGSSGEPLIVILNDNGMSIDGNVGAVSEHLGLLRSKPAYYEFKKAYRDLLDRKRGRPRGGDFNHHLKTNVKKALLPNSTMFEDMGFTYLGPVNGHDGGSSPTRSNGRRT